MGSVNRSASIQEGCLQYGRSVVQVEAIQVTCCFANLIGKRRLRNAANKAMASDDVTGTLANDVKL